MSSFYYFLNCFSITCIFLKPSFLCVELHIPKCTQWGLLSLGLGTDEWGWVCSSSLHYFLVFMIMLCSVCHILNCHSQDNESVSCHRCWQQTNLLLRNRKLQSIDKWMKTQNRDCIYRQNSLFDVLEFRLRMYDIRNDLNSDSNKNINCSPLALHLVPPYKPCSFN